MAQRVIVATFEDDGTVHVEGHGFKGKQCVTEMAPYEAVLGLDGAPKVAKPEMAQAEAPKRKQKEKARA
jgi:hypothetical protein